LWRPWIAVGLLAAASLVVACAARQESTMNEKVARELQRLMERDPGITYSVIVTFTQPMDDEQVDSLGLIPGSPVESLGQLTGDAIRALAARPDVARIRSSPKVKPS
jgi:hypothetical protein